MKNENFNQLVDRICQSQDLKPLRTVIEKELLHYDILFALSQSGILDTLTFQGGTALRLCYGLGRFSEDLDFVGGHDFSRENFFHLKDVIESYLSRRYGLQVLVKEPSQQETTDNALQVVRWQVAVLTRPDERHIPKQKIRVEVANIPAYTRKLMPLLSNYDFLPDGYTETFVNVESLEEILADKIIAFGARPYVKYRDIWDLQWMLQKKIVFNSQYVKNKISDYGLIEYKRHLRQRKQQLPEIIASNKFHQEMSRFLNRETLARTLNKPGFDTYLVESMVALLEEVLAVL